MILEQRDRGLATLLLRQMIEQIGERLLVASREERLALRGEPVGERRRADAALLATVGHEPFGFELLQVMTHRVG